MRSVSMLLAISLAGAAQAGAALTDAQEAIVEASIRARLKDPDSAKFGPSLIVDDQAGVLTVCGVVNARNGFGGYAGQRPFVGALVNGRFVLLELGETSANAAAVLKVCAPKQ